MRTWLPLPLLQAPPASLLPPVPLPLSRWIRWLSLTAPSRCLLFLSSHGPHLSHLQDICSLLLTAQQTVDLLANLPGDETVPESLKALSGSYAATLLVTYVNFVSLSPVSIARSNML
jgi:hypothetical protein